MHFALRNSLAARLRFFFQRLATDHTPVQVYLRGRDVPARVWMRAQDFNMLKEQFLHRHYHLPLPLSLSSDLTVVDAGAHIGLATLYLASHYFPNAHFCLIEPSEKNRIILERNMMEAGLRVQIIAGGISAQSGRAFFDENSMGYNVRIGYGGATTHPASVPVWSISSFMQQNGWEHIDFIKMDVEGAEQFILTENNAWLQHTHAILLEIHPPFTVAQLYAALSPFGFNITATAHDAIWYAVKGDGERS